jgi:carbamoyltransferase
MSVILGINAYHAGSSAALVIDGIPVVAIAEERLNRKKYYANFPAMAIRLCLEKAGLRLCDIDYVTLGRDPSANFAQKAAFSLRNIGSLPSFLKMRKRRTGLSGLREVLAAECDADIAGLRFKQVNVEHHLAHMASAYFISEWNHAAGITIDGSGDFASCMLAECKDENIKILRRVFLPHSLGMFYTMVCQFIGYNSYGDEGKVMGLASLGTDTYAKEFRDMVRIKPGGFELNLKYFTPVGRDGGLSISEDGEMIQPIEYTDAMVRLFGQPRVARSEITKRDMDLAFCLQQLFEEVYMHMLNLLHRKVPTEKLVLSGGCALNSVANGRIFCRTPFRSTCIQPASGDEGLSLGAALHVSNAILKEKTRYVMRSSYLGPEFSDAEIKAALHRNGCERYEELDRNCLLKETAEEVAAGKVVGWFQGKMEWGPRALGNRSILAHPGLPTMKDTLNARIKHREWFRPFAPSVLAERQTAIFKEAHPSPFMLHVYEIKPEWRERLCAVNHVDNTGRLQSVARDENPLYYDLIKAFEAKTGIPVILNTSFNENEPIVCNPDEAIACFKRTKMDVLVIGSFICRKVWNG